MNPSHSHSPRFDSLPQEAFLNVWRTYDKLKALEDELFERHQLSAQQYNTLRLLRAAAPRSVPTLALGAKLISRAPDMTRLIDKLESRGLVRRQRRDDNRRIVEVALTDAGSQLLQDLDAPVLACAAQQLGHMADDDLRHLIDLLNRARSPHEEPGSHWLTEK